MGGNRKKVTEEVDKAAILGDLLLHPAPPPLSNQVLSDAPVVTERRWPSDLQPGLSYESQRSPRLTGWSKLDDAIPLVPATSVSSISVKGVVVSSRWNRKPPVVFRTFLFFPIEPLMSCWFFWYHPVQASAPYLGRFTRFPELTVHLGQI